LHFILQYVYSVLTKKVLGDIKELHGLRLSLEVGSGLVPIVITQLL